jgi:nicotinamide-nucleotide amidase
MDSLNPQVNLIHLAGQVGAALSRKEWMLATAESCTGGWIAQSLTEIGGSSGWFDRGFVTYSNAAKTDMLGVDAGLIATQGAVSEAVVLAMVAGALRFSQARVAVAVSGIAGPTGGTPEKPVGTVWFAWQVQGGEPVAHCEVLSGDRHEVRRQAVIVALRGVLDLLEA